MRPTIRLLLLANLVYTALSFAQGTKPAEVAKHKFKHNGEIDSRYDASSDKTIVVLNPYKIPPKSQDVFSIMCGFTFKGRTISAPPDSIEFHIFSDGISGWKFDNEKKRMLSATIDGEHVQLGEMKIVNTRHYAFNGRNGFLEQVYIQLTYEALVKVASGKRVWLNIGEEKIRLEDEHLEALRDLASRMARKTQHPSVTAQRLAKYIITLERPG
jgi:hypothetical protein